jgi:cell division GTPase FtsZ
MLTKSIMSFLKKHGKEAKAICCLPFKFETSRKEIATDTVSDIEKLGKVNFIDLDSASRSYGNLNLSEFFDKVNEDTYSIYKSI